MEYLNEDAKIQKRYSDTKWVITQIVVVPGTRQTFGEGQQPSFSRP